jgi:hypothetical protein
LANVPKQLIATALTTSTVTYHTTPAGTTTIIKEVLICNTSTADRTVTVSLGGFSVVSSITVAPKETVVLGLSTVVPAARAITATANGTGVNLLVSALEVA